MNGGFTRLRRSKYDSEVDLLALNDGNVRNFLERTVATEVVGFDGDKIGVQNEESIGQERSVVVGDHRSSTIGKKRRSGGKFGPKVRPLGNTKTRLIGEHEVLEECSATPNYTATKSDLWRLVKKMAKDVKKTILFDFRNIR